MSNILEIEKLNVVYRIPEGRRHVLRDVSLELRKGEIMAVVGESGCGKSTLVNTVISLLPSNAMIESGRISPKIDTLWKISEALGMKLSEMIEQIEALTE